MPSLCIHICPPTFTANIDVVSVLPLAELLRHNHLLKQIHLFFVLEIDQDLELKVLETILLFSFSETFPAAKVFVFYVVGLVFSDVDLAIDKIRDLVDQIVLLLAHSFTFIASFERRVYLLRQRYCTRSVGSNHESSTSLAVPT